MLVTQVGEWLAATDPRSDPTRRHNAPLLGWARVSSRATREKKNGKPMDRGSPGSSAYRGVVHSVAVTPQPGSTVTRPGYAPSTPATPTSCRSGSPLHPRPRTSDLVAHHPTDITARSSGRRAGRPLVGGPPRRDPAPATGLPGPMTRGTHGCGGRPQATKEGWFSSRDAGHDLQKGHDLARTPRNDRSPTNAPASRFRYLFMDHGKLLSLFLLFNTPIQPGLANSRHGEFAAEGGRSLAATIPHTDSGHTSEPRLANAGRKLQPS